MLIIISAAKKLDLESPPKTDKYSIPSLLPGSILLVDKLKKCEISELTKLMNISYGLSELNLRRYETWNTPFTPENARQACFTYFGDVYQGLDIKNFSQKDIDYAQKTLRIISGLYGTLRPLDLIQPYRLPMGTKLITNKGKNLYDFWGEKITEQINKSLAEKNTKILINLASNEYFKALNPKKINATIYKPVFMQFKNGNYRVVSFYAKKARGLMSQYIIKNKITNIEDLKNFNMEDYSFNKELSVGEKLVFVR